MRHVLRRGGATVRPTAPPGPARRPKLSRLACAGALLAAFAVAPATAGAAPTSYVNPVSDDFSDTFADPAILKAKDGYWYSYATSDPLREGERTHHIIPIARSTDLVNWTYVGDAFTNANRPAWAEPTAGIWAPDVRYIDGRYVMYFGVTDTTLYPGPNDSAIGVATAPTAAGPWTVQNGPVVGPRPNGDGQDGNFFWTFDSTGFTDIDGKHYLYYGSYYGGIWVTELTSDGLRAAPDADTQVAIDNRYEAAYVIRRNGWIYLFGSSANCCAGPTTGYSVYVGRSRSPRGPFLDREGQSMTESRVGGTIVVTPNGNRWVGPGHNAIVTDLAGQDWFAYHAIDRNDPFLDEPFGINERPMLLDRLDWINGWPTVRSGYWASEEQQVGPVTTPIVGDSFNSGSSLGQTWKQDGAWRLVRSDEDARGFARQQANACNKPRLMIAGGSLPADVRVEADIRLPDGSSGGVVVRYRDDANYAVARLDSRTRSVVVEVVVNGVRTQLAAQPLAADFPFGVWHNVAVEVRGTAMTVEVTDARLNDPYAVVKVTLPTALASGGAGVEATCSRVDADNFSAAELYRPRTTKAPVPTRGTLTFSDGFNDGTLGGPGWTWLRGPAPGATESGGMLRWPVEDTDLVGGGNNASILYRQDPEGTYIAQTKCTIDLGVDIIRNYQQCGMIAYVNDDLWLRLSHVAIWNTRQTEFGKEQPFADGLSFGGMLIGPPADTTWLRLAHRLDPENGEHEFRAATSRDGQRWIWGGVWTLPAGTDVKIGLISHGRQTGERATSQFDYFRVYTGGTWGNWPGE